MVRIPGSHAPNVKNRSSKHLIPLTKVRPIYRCLSNAALEALSRGDGKNKGDYDAQKELNRRQKKRDKKNGLQT